MENLELCGSWYDDYLVDHAMTREESRMGSLKPKATVLAAVGGTMVVLSLLVAALSAMPWIRIDPMEAVRHT